jgi:hypothetical protein
MSLLVLLIILPFAVFVGSALCVCAVWPYIWLLDFLIDSNIHPVLGMTILLSAIAIPIIAVMAIIIYCTGSL